MRNKSNCNTHQDKPFVKCKRIAVSSCRYAYRQLSQSLSHEHSCPLKLITNSSPCQNNHHRSIKNYKDYPQQVAHELKGIKIQLSVNKKNLKQCVDTENIKKNVSKPVYSLEFKKHEIFDPFENQIISQKLLESKPQVLLFYSSSVFDAPHKFKRFSKILKNKFCFQGQKGLNVIQMAAEQSNMENTYKRKVVKMLQNKSMLTRPRYYKNNQLVPQVFSPKLKHKKRPSSGVPLKRYSNLFVTKKRTQSYSIPLQAKSLQSRHIKSLHYSNASPSSSINRCRKQNAKNVLVSRTRLFTEPIESNFVRYQEKSQSILLPWQDEIGKGKKYEEFEL